MVPRGAGRQLEPKSTKEYSAKFRKNQLKFMKFWEHLIHSAKLSKLSLKFAEILFA
jgi:hypothetical protein